MFFSFEFNEVQDDVRYILQQYFQDYTHIKWDEPILRQTKYLQQQNILELYDHRSCNTLHESA